MNHKKYAIIGATNSNSKKGKTMKKSTSILFGFVMLLLGNICPPATPLVAQMLEELSEPENPALLDSAVKQAQYYHLEVK